jgi:hypothetical protein
MSATTTAICVIVMGTGGGTIRPPLPLAIRTSRERYAGTPAALAADLARVRVYLAGGRSSRW